MNANITLYPGQMQQMRFVMTQDLVFTTNTDWDYGTTIVINNKDSLVCFTADTEFALKDVTVIEVCNAGMQPFNFTVRH